MSHRQAYRLDDLDAQALVLTSALSVWQDPAVPGAVVRQAANDAVGAVDAMLRLLRELRAGLASEIRAWDDQTGRRVDALLAELRDRCGEVV